VAILVYSMTSTVFFLFSTGNNKTIKLKYFNHRSSRLSKTGAVIILYFYHRCDCHIRNVARGIYTLTNKHINVFILCIYNSPRVTCFYLTATLAVFTLRVESSLVGLGTGKKSGLRELLYWKMPIFFVFFFHLIT